MSTSLRASSSTTSWTVRPNDTPSDKTPIKSAEQTRGAKPGTADARAQSCADGSHPPSPNGNAPPDPAAAKIASTRRHRSQAYGARDDVAFPLACFTTFASQKSEECAKVKPTCLETGFGFRHPYSRPVGDGAVDGGHLRCLTRCLVLVGVALIECLILHGSENHRIVSGMSVDNPVLTIKIQKFFCHCSKKQILLCKTSIQYISCIAEIHIGICFLCPHMPSMLLSNCLPY